MVKAGWGVTGESSGDATVLPFDARPISQAVDQRLQEADAQRCAYCDASSSALARCAPTLTGLAGALLPFLRQIGDHLENVAVHHLVDVKVLPCRTRLPPAQFAATQHAMERTLQDLADSNPALRTCLQSYPDKEAYSQSKRLQCLARELPAITAKAENTLQHVRTLLNVSDHALQSSTTDCSAYATP